MSLQWLQTIADQCWHPDPAFTLLMYQTEKLSAVSEKLSIYTVSQ